MNELDDMSLWAVFFGVAMHAEKSRGTFQAESCAACADQALEQLKAHSDKLQKKTGKH